MAVIRAALVLLEQTHVRLPVVLPGEQPADVDAEVLDQLGQDVEVRLLGLILDDVAQLVRVDIELAGGGDEVP